jgi:hypothetical protein
MTPRVGLSRMVIVECDICRMQIVNLQVKHIFLFYAETRL